MGIGTFQSQARASASFSGLIWLPVKKNSSLPISLGTRTEPVSGSLLDLGNPRLAGLEDHSQLSLRQLLCPFQTYGETLAERGTVPLAAGKKTGPGTLRCPARV